MVSLTPVIFILLIREILCLHCNKITQTANSFIILTGSVSRIALLPPPKYTHYNKYECYITDILNVLWTRY